jgi:hypothetical protein
MQIKVFSFCCLLNFISRSVDYYFVWSLFVRKLLISYYHADVADSANWHGTNGTVDDNASQQRGGSRYVKDESPNGKYCHLA